MDKKISESTIYRLSRYYRSLEHLIEKKIETTSSDDLAEIDGITSAQVRKDLSFFGSFGKRGLGYNTRDLKDQIASILGINRTWNVAIIGAGNIGRALVDYQEFKKQGFIMKILLDTDPNKIGTKYHNVKIENYNNTCDLLKENNVEIGIIAVPAERAQTVADKLVEAGIKSILNFAPRSIKVPDNVKVQYENMAIELESLSYYL
ncbi:MAG: redox-sensing transcriptional repressor Rex, partial [Calditrichia bacterium]|nr:redox-sensing transcriptional repressor Rex [Calditrichia bacterium]